MSFAHEKTRSRRQPAPGLTPRLTPRMSNNTYILSRVGRRSKDGTDDRPGMLPRADEAARPRQ